MLFRSSENTTQDAQIEIGALWKKQGKTQKFLSGTINLKAIGYDKDVQIVVFTNKFKQKETHPDLRMYVSKPKPGTAPVAAKPAAAPAKAKAVAKPAPETEEAVSGAEDEVI